MTFKGLVEINDHQLYAEYTRSNEAGLPSLVLLNGLSSSTSDWDTFLEPLLSLGYGTLRFDFRGQGRSLQDEIKKLGSFDKQVSFEEQTEDLLSILKYFNVPEPFYLVGMSYGGGIGFYFASKYPEKIGKIISIVPYLVRLDQAHSSQRKLGAYFNSKVRNVVGDFGSFGNQVLEVSQQWYEKCLLNYMDKRFSQFVPDSVVRKAALQLTLGIMRFDAFQVISSLPTSSLHLVTVGQDSLIPEFLFTELWSKCPAHIKESWLYIENGEHLILDQFPVLVANWVKLILAKDSRLHFGKRFKAKGPSFTIMGEEGEVISCSFNEN